MILTYFRAFAARITLKSEMKQTIYFQDCLIHCIQDIQAVFDYELNSEMQYFIILQLRGIQSQASTKRVISFMQDYNLLVNKFKRLLQENIVNFDELKYLSWSGVPSQLRHIVWPILLGYSSPNKDANFTLLDRKRSEYHQMVNVYFGQEKDLNSRELQMIKIISEDIKRTIPEAQIFRNPMIQECLKRILFIWNMRNPAPGFFDGINDIVAPLVVTYLSQYLTFDMENLIIDSTELAELDIQIQKQFEADVYFSLSKLLEPILDNYTQNQPGMNRFHNKLHQIVLILDKPLLQHLENQGIYLLGYVYRWGTCMLLRLFTFKVGLRLFDTYLAEKNQFDLQIYILATLLLRVSKRIKKLEDTDLLIFLDQLPFKSWTEEDLNLCISEAYSYQKIFSQK